MRVQIVWGDGAVTDLDTGYSSEVVSRARLVPSEVGLVLRAGEAEEPIAGVLGRPTVDACMSDTFTARVVGHGGDGYPSSVLHGDVPYRLEVDGEALWTWPVRTVDEDGRGLTLTPAEVEAITHPERWEGRDEWIVKVPESKPGETDGEGQSDMPSSGEDPDLEETASDLVETAEDNPDFGDDDGFVEVPVVFE